MTCRVCGSEMMDGACETCIRWFGKSSAVTECERCGREYGGYPLVENALALTLRLAVGDVPWNPRQHCPYCRIAAHAAGHPPGPCQEQQRAGHSPVSSQRSSPAFAVKPVCFSP